MTPTSMPPRSRLFRDEEPEWLVWALVALLLAIGLVAKTIVVNESTTFSESNVSVSYPADWTSISSDAPGTLLSAGQTFAGDLFPARLVVQQMAAANISRNAESLGDLALKWSDDHAQELLGYRVLSIEPVQVRGKDAVRVDYAYVAEPELAVSDTMPIIARGADILFREGETVTAVRLLSASDAFDGLSTTWDRIASSIGLK